VPAVVLTLLLVADQASKLWILRTLGPVPGQRSIPLIGDWFSLEYVRNTGVAFGLFQNASPIFTVTSLLISAGAVYAYIHYLPNRNPWVQVCMGLVLGGALGNVLDRIRLGYVVDFLAVGWWPRFNFADSAVTVGVLVLAVFLLFEEDSQPQSPPQDDALLGDLLTQDAEAPAPAHRANPGMTDSGRRIADSHDS
jgi:signal peptidase II